MRGKLLEDLTEALDLLRGKRKGGGIILQHDGAQFKATCEDVAKKIEQVNRAFTIPKEVVYAKPPDGGYIYPHTGDEHDQFGKRLKEIAEKVAGINPEPYEKPCEHRSEDGPDGEVQCMDCNMIVDASGNWVKRQ